MDTSKEYIKMCDCREIQAEQDRCGDMLSFHANNNCDDIWLPRQDQLQEMLINRYKGNDCDLKYHDAYEQLLFDCNNFVNCSYVACLGYSMEQLWIAFVMKEKFKKEWNGKKWI